MMFLTTIIRYSKIISWNRCYSKVTHCIFDFDGTILDTLPGYNVAAAQVLGKFGKEYTTHWQRKVLGMTSKDMWSIVKAEFDLPASVEQLTKEYRSLGRVMTKDCPFKSGVGKLICHFHKCNVPMAVATCSRSDTLKYKSKHIKEYMDMFHHIVCGGSDKDVKNAKPSPDVFLVCADRFPDKPKPACCLVFEDSAVGITAAICAGMQCVAIPEEISLPEDSQHATLVLKSMDEFQPDLFGLPPLKNE